jgi:hypothetical protein
MSAPAAKGLFRPGQDDAADLLVFFGGLQRLGQLLQQLRVERVHRVGAVEPDDGDVVFDLDDQGFIGHASEPPAVWTPAGLVGRRSGAQG